jgi:hypothetical protein
MFMKDLFRAMNSHGMKVLPEVNNIDEALDHVTVRPHGVNPEQVRFRKTHMNRNRPSVFSSIFQLYEACNEAMKAARRYFLSNMGFRGFSTTVTFDDGKLSNKCLVARDESGSSEAGFYAIHRDPNSMTHTVTNRRNGHTQFARIQYKVGTDTVDPCDFNRLRNGT